MHQPDGVAWDLFVTAAKEAVLCVEPVGRGRPKGDAVLHEAPEGIVVVRSDRRMFFLRMKPEVVDRLRACATVVVAEGDGKQFVEEYRASWASSRES